MRIRADIDLVGHSMGCLLLVNAVRVMADFFHFPGQESDSLSRAATIRLRTLILCGADIPMALAVPGRNNYFLSSLRRFRAIHVLSSDHDVVLKWASSLGNWASEPRFDMSSRRLGNAFLIDHEAFPRRFRATPREGSYLPVSRPGPRYIPAAIKAWSLDPDTRRATLQIHDCSRCWSVGGNLGWAFGVGAIAAFAGYWLWILPGALGKWFAGLLWCLLSAGAVSRWLQVRFMDKWRIGPVLGFLADWPSSTAFGSRMRNPHGGYFVRGDQLRSLISRLITGSPTVGESVLVEAPAPVRSSALIIPV